MAKTKDRKVRALRILTRMRRLRAIFFRTWLNLWTSFSSWVWISSPIAQLLLYIILLLQSSAGAKTFDIIVSALCLTNRITYYNTMVKEPKRDQQQRVASAAIPVPEYQPNFFTKQIELSALIGFKCTHISFFVCWFGLVLAGTTIIGFGASNYSESFNYCDDAQPFCFYDFTLYQNRDLFIYSKIQPFHQNNRMYLDAYSWRQLAGQNGTGAQCGGYKTYGKLEKNQTSGGYRVTPATNVHPCGFPMLNLFNDSAYIVQSDGGTPKINNDTISNYSKTYLFQRLQNYAVSQWTDVQQSNFVNWFTIGTTSGKYMLMGKLLNMSSGDYRLVVKNSFPTHGEFSKQIIISEVNNLGVTNHLLGFALFAYGIGMLLIHVAICCKSRE